MKSPPPPLHFIVWKVENVLVVIVNSGVSQVYDRLEDLGADTAEARASHLLSGLQFTHEMQVSSKY